MKKLLTIFLLGISIIAFSQEENDRLNDKEIKVFEKLVEDSNDAGMQYNLGVMYYKGYKGFPVDIKKSIYWLEKSAKNGKSRAQFDLGTLYYDGLVMPIDMKKAMFWIKKSAEQGEERAKQILEQEKLAKTYFKNKSLKSVREKALKGDADVQFELAMFYTRADEGSISYYWMKESGENGNLSAQLLLGMAMLKAENYKKSAYWIKKAKEQGDEDAKKLWKEYELWKYEE